MAIAGCSADVKGNPPALTATSAPLRLHAGSTGDTLDLFSAALVEPGDPYWSGMASVVNVQDEPVTILNAAVVTLGAATAVDVFAGVDGVDGIHGATPREPSGAELPGTPVPAEGHRLDRDVTTVLYAVATLDSANAAGAIVGVNLSYRAGDGTVYTAMVLSPTLLCPGPVEEWDTGICGEVKAQLTDEVEAILEGHA